MRVQRRLADAARSPGRLVAFIGRVGSLVLRGEFKAMLTRVHPRGPGPAEYRAWRAAQPALDPRESPIPYLVLLDPADANARTLMIAAFSLPTDARAVLIRDDTRWRRVPDGPVRPLSTWLAELDATSAWLWWVSEPLRIEPGASRVIAEACSVAGARIVYADHDLADLAGRPALPVLKPAWDDEQILEHNYAGTWLVLHASLASAIDAPRASGASGPWRALVSLSSALPPEAFVQVPRALAHLPAEPPTTTIDTREREAMKTTIEAAAARRGDAIEVDAHRVPWIRYSNGEASVSIVMPIRDRPKLLERCLAGLRAAAARAELVIVDNGSTDRRVARLLEAAGRERPLVVVPAPEPFNFPRLCNAGVAAAKGRVVVLLNNDTQVPEDDWLDELVSLAARRRIGAVGPLMLYPDGLVQSAGVLVGANRTATSALAGFLPDDPVVRAWCATRRRVSAVLGACLAVERDKYFAVGGLDERFAVSHNEVDFCLRLEAAGFANLFTPFVRIVHEEGATRGFEVTAGERARLAEEEALFHSRWSHLIAATDPAHHPCLARDGNPFALAVPPVDPRPRAGWRAYARVRQANREHATG